MEQVSIKKKKAIIAVSVITAIVLILVISLCAALAPRNIKTILPLDNIEKITMQYINENLEMSRRELNDKEKNYLLSVLKDTKYKPIYQQIKTQGPIIFFIYYTNGDIAQIQQYRMNIIDKDGNTKLSRTYILDFDYSEFKGLAGLS